MRYVLKWKRGEKGEGLAAEANSKYKKCHARMTHWINEGSLKREKAAAPFDEAGLGERGERKLPQCNRNGYPCSSINTRGVNNSSITKESAIVMK